MSSDLGDDMSDRFRDFVTLLMPNNIPTLNGPVYIYGAGNAGQTIRSKIEERIEKPIDGFLTSFDTYTDKSIVVYSIEDKWKEINRSDVSIFILNQYAREIINSLYEKGIKAKLINGIHYLYPQPLYFSDENETSLIKGSLKVEEQLSSLRSKHIYTHLINNRKRKGSESDLVTLYAHFFLFMNEYYGLGDAYSQLQYVEYHDLSELDVIIEGGTCFGDVTLKLLPLLGGQGILYSFDPCYGEVVRSGSNTHILQQMNLAAACGKLLVHEKALWHRVEQLFFSADGNFSQRQIRESGIKIEATSLDAFCSETGVQNIDFIKLDIEGAEPNFLQGGMNMIKRSRPSMSISIYHGGDQIVTIPQFLMAELVDYEFEIGHHSNSPWHESVLYAIPKEKTL